MKEEIVVLVILVLSTPICLSVSAQQAMEKKSSKLMWKALGLPEPKVKKVKVFEGRIVQEDWQDQSGNQPGGSGPGGPRPIPAGSTGMPILGDLHLNVETGRGESRGYYTAKAGFFCVCSGNSSKDPNCTGDLWFAEPDGTVKLYGRQYMDGSFKPATPGPSLNEQAERLARVGNYNEATNNYVQALFITESYLGPNHPAVLTVMKRLADVARKANRDVLAKEIDKQIATFGQN